MFILLTCLGASLATGVSLDELREETKDWREMCEERTDWREMCEERSG